MMEAVPNTLDEVFQLIGDYGLYPWLIQVSQGDAERTTLGPNQAMILARLIELGEAEL